MKPLTLKHPPVTTLARPAKGSDPRAWGLPQPLAPSGEPKPYPLDALPPTVRAAVEEVQGFVKAPVPLVAASALGALSLAVQAHVDMKRAERLTGPVGVFLLTIAASGERKSTCDRLFFQAIRDFERQRAEAAEAVLKARRPAADALEARLNGLRIAITTAAKAGEDTRALEADLAGLEQQAPEAPRVPRLLYADVTPEQLKWELARIWPSAGVVTSEGGTVLGAHGMGQESIMRNLAIYNQLWDGADLPTDRRTSESFLVHGARLTIALQVQEATLRRFLHTSGELARGIGFLSRCLMAWPESTQGSRPFTDAPPAWPRLEAFNRRMTAILERDVALDASGGLRPLLLTFTPAAKAAWVAFHDKIERQLKAGGQYHEIRDVASKAADNAARLAALFHVFEGLPGTAVAGARFKAASRIAEWHLGEALRFLGELDLPSGLEDAARLESWLIAHCHRHRRAQVPFSDALRLGPGRLREKARLEAALQDLEVRGRARSGQDGRQRHIAVHPALLAPGRVAKVANPAKVVPALEPTGYRAGGVIRNFRKFRKRQA